MRVLVTGANGQLGRALIDSAPSDVEVLAFGSDGLDITDRDAVYEAVLSAKPDVVFNAAAYTAVDRAESDEAAAYAVNALGVGNLAAAIGTHGGRLVHISTDFVFGANEGSPLATDAPTAPIGAYGRTKLAGEQAAGDGALIVRTAWVYAPFGHNFVRTMLRLMAERDEVRVVADQVGTPTYAPGLAAALWRLAELGVTGIQHYTDAGVASWYDFAVAIQEEALAAGLLQRAVPVIPIATRDYPTPAARPAYSVLDCSGSYRALEGPAPHWRVNLRRMISAIAVQG